MAGLFVCLLLVLSDCFFWIIPHSVDSKRGFHRILEECKSIDIRKIARSVLLFACLPAPVAAFDFSGFLCYNQYNII